MGCGQSSEAKAMYGMPEEVPYLKLSSFDVLEVLGFTHSSSVVRLRNKSTGSAAAGKCIKKRSNEFEGGIYKSEIKMLSKLQKVSGVVKLLGISSTPEDFWFVLELCSGGTLDRWLMQQPETARSVTWELVDTVRRLHSMNICHQDLKPDNVVITETGQVRLIDFEQAKEIAVGTKFVGTIGTKGYQAPEMLSGKPYCPLKADVFALGRTLQKVVEAMPMRHQRELAGICEKMLTEDPQSRPNMNDVAFALFGT